MKIMRVLLVGVGVLALVAGAGPAAAQQKVKIGYAFDPDIRDIGDFVGYEMFAAKRGVQVQIVQINQAPALVSALVAGEVDIAETTPRFLAFARMRATDLVAFIAQGARSEDVLVATKSIPSTSALAGKRVAFTSLGSPDEVLAKAVVGKAGVAEASVQWMAIGGSANRAAALKAGRVDAAMLKIGDAVALEATGEFRTLVRVADVEPTVAEYLLNATGKYLRENPQIIQTLVTSLIEGWRWIYANPEEFIALVKKRLPAYDDAVVRRAVKMYMEIGMWPKDGGLSPAVFAANQEWLVKNKLLPKPQPFEEAATDRFIREALAALGPAR